MLREVRVKRNLWYRVDLCVVAIKLRSELSSVRAGSRIWRHMLLPLLHLGQGRFRPHGGAWIETEKGEAMAQKKEGFALTGGRGLKPAWPALSPRG